MRTCKVQNCNNKHKAKGYCSKHYYQFKRHGHILERTRHDKNEIIEYEDYAEIILYDKDNNEVARTMISLEYVGVVKDYKWYLKQEGYAFNKEIGYLHRLIMNPPKDMVVDHINQDKLDNRRDNLRICTDQENKLNHSIYSNNTSGASGVSWSKRYNKWEAQLQVNREVIYLGRYNTKEEAMEARRQAEIEYFGEFAPNKE